MKKRNKICTAQHRLRNRIDIGIILSARFCRQSHFLAFSAEAIDVKIRHADRRISSVHIHLYEYHKVFLWSTDLPLEIFATNAWASCSPSVEKLQFFALQRLYAFSQFLHRRTFCQECYSTASIFTYPSIFYEVTYLRAEIFITLCKWVKLQRTKLKNFDQQKSS